MSLDVQVGGLTLPLDTALITENRLREPADPLLTRLVDFLKAVLTAELQSALEAISGLPAGLTSIAVSAIPADPVKFLTTISRDDFPLLCVYRAQRTWVPWTIDQRKRETIWNVDYVLPEVEQFQLGTLLGIDNAVEIALAEALTLGRHSAYNSGASVLNGMNVEIMEPLEAVSSNWNYVDDKNQSISYPALRLTFRTVELVTENTTGSNLVPLKNVGITQNLSTEGASDVDDFVVSEVEDLDA